MAEAFFLEIKSNIDDNLVWLKPKKFDDDDYAMTHNFKERAEEAIVAYGKLVEIVRNTVSNIFDICYYLNSFSTNSWYLRTMKLDYADSEHTTMKEDEVISFVEKLGISKSSFYRYRDIGKFVDVENHRLISELDGYSISQLTEILTYVRSQHGQYCDLKREVLKATKVILSSATVSEIQTYRSVMQLRHKNKSPFEWSSDPNSMYQKVKYDTKLEDVLKIWKEWEEGQANKQLEETMSGKTATNDPTPEFDEIIRSLREEIQTLRLGYVPELGMCEGCKFKGVNLNKCRCCKRNKDMKDLFEAN